MNFYLPEQIKMHVSDMECIQNDVGCSQATIYKFFSNEKVLYLKVESKSGELETEYNNIRWLQGKLLVPHIIEWVTDDGFNYLLLSEMKGRMACDDYYLQNPHMAVTLLSEGIKQLQAVNINNCPINNDLNRKLYDASENIKNNYVDMTDWESNNRFTNPSELLKYLKNNKPKNEELVFTHGDYCLPNIFGMEEKIGGFIDMGRAGIADKWQDIALCIRSLHHNFHTEEYDELLLSQIGISMNKEKLDYYILLDELF